MTTELATKIAKTARLRYKELERLNPDGHGSHLASEALEYAEALHGANTFGIEGSCWNMHDGITYLNTGDTYETTVYALTHRYSARFYVGSWGDYVERHPSRFD